MRLKILHKYLLKSFAGPLILAFCIVVFILLMQWLWLWIDDIAGKGLDFKIIVELLFYTACTMVPMALPIAVLFSSIMTIGNLGERNELVAMKSSGISLFRILKPMMAAAVFLVMVAFMFANYGLPFANLKMRSLMYDIQNKRPEMQISEGVFYSGIDNYRILIGSKNYQTNMLYDMKIYDHSQSTENKKVTVADSGKMYMTDDKRYLVIDMYNGYNYEEVDSNTSLRTSAGTSRNNSHPFRKNSFGMQTIQIDISEFDMNRSDESLFKRNYPMMKLSELTSYRDSVNNVADNMKVEMHGKILESTTASTHFVRGERIDSTMLLRKALPIDILAAIDSTSVMEHIAICQDARTFARSTASVSINYTNDISEISESGRRARLEWWKKFSLSFSCLVFFFIGAPLGALIRKGGLAVPMVVSVIFFVLYYIFSSMGEKFAREDVITPFIGSWAATFIIFPLGIILFYHAVNDSSALNSETFQNLSIWISEKFKELKGSRFIALITKKKNGIK